MVEKAPLDDFDKLSPGSQQWHPIGRAAAALSHIVPHLKVAHFGSASLAGWVQWSDTDFSSGRFLRC
jgi:hypothetical protein